MRINLTKKIAGLAVIVALSSPFYNCKGIQLPTILNDRVEHMDIGEEFFVCNSWDDMNKNKKLEIGEIEGYNKKEFYSKEKMTLVGKFSADNRKKDYECWIMKKITGVENTGRIIYCFYGEVDPEAQIIKIDFKPYELEKKAGIGQYIVRWNIKNRAGKATLLGVHRFEIK